MKENLATLLDRKEKIITKAFISADKALTDYYSLLIFEGFEETDEPVISFTSSHEVILEFLGRELSPKEIKKLMITKGYIEPTDFYKFYGEIADKI